MMNHELLGTMFRMMLDGLKGQQLVDVSADDSEDGGAILLFSNGDTLRFGYFSYEPAGGKTELDKKIKDFVTDHPEFIVKEHDDNDNQCD